MKKKKKKLSSGIQQKTSHYRYWEEQENALQKAEYFFHIQESPFLWRHVSHDAFRLVLVQLTSTSLKGNSMTYITMRSVHLNTVCPAAQSYLCTDAGGGRVRYQMLWCVKMPTFYQSNQ